MDKKVQTVIIITITLATYIFTLHPAVKPFLYRLFVFYLTFSLWGLIYYAWSKHRNVTTASINLIIYIASVTILFLVGMTGWFFSPFVYLLYLMAIAFSFLFSRAAATFFIVILTGLYIPHIDDVPIWYSAVILLSLFGTLLVVDFLMVCHLRIKEGKKGPSKIEP